MVSDEIFTCTRIAYYFAGRFFCLGVLCGAGRGSNQKADKVAHQGVAEAAKCASGRGHLVTFRVVDFR